MTGIYRASALSGEIIKLLIDEDRGIRHEVYKAVGKIGKSAFSSLLAEINDRSNSAEYVARCVTCLRNIGYFDGEISEVLSKSFLSAIDKDDKELLVALLFTSAHLRDPNQVQNAKILLSNSDKQITHAAAKYLTEFPDKCAWDALWDVLQRASNSKSGDKDHFDDWLFSQTIAALLKIDPPKAQRELNKLIRDGLKGTGVISPFQAERLIKKHDLTFGYPLLLEFVTNELRTAPPHKYAHSLSEMLGSTWTPAALKCLIEENERLASHDFNVASIFVNAVAPNNKENDEYLLGDRLNRISDLRTPIKCQAPNFVLEAKRLLKDAPFLSTRELGLYFWVIGDESAENTLLKRFGKINEGETRRHSRESILRALGTCGTKKSAPLILSYLKEETDLSLAFPREILFPLLKRKILTTESLVTLCKDETSSYVGRAVGLHALAMFNAPRFTEVFVELAKDDNDLVQQYALKSLGFTKSKLAIAPLRDIFISNSSFGMKSYAAKALMILDAKEAIADIEHAFEDCADESSAVHFLDPLTQFRSNRSIPIILDRLGSASPEHRGYYLGALGSFISDAEVIRKLFSELEASVDDSSGFFNDQSQLIDGLTYKWEKEVFVKILTYLERNRLSERSRVNIARNLPGRFKDRSSDKKLLMRIMKFLVCDHSVNVRDRAMNSLTLLTVKLCKMLHQEIMNSPDANEWTRACAVESLGFWASASSEIDSMPFENELLVRQAANKASEHKKHLQTINYHISEFQSDDGIARLSAYLCLGDNGYLSTIWQLHKIERKRLLNFTYIENLIRKISERRRKDIQEIQKMQDKQKNERGAIYFD